MLSFRCLTQSRRNVWCETQDVDTLEALRRLPPELLLAPRRDNSAPEHPRAGSPKGASHFALSSGEADAADDLRSSFHSLGSGSMTRSLIPHRSDVARVGESLINIHPLFRSKIPPLRLGVACSRLDDATDRVSGPARVVLSTSKNSVPEGLHGLNVIDFRISEPGPSYALCIVNVFNGTDEKHHAARCGRATASSCCQARSPRYKQR